MEVQADIPQTRPGLNMERVTVMLNVLKLLLLLDKLTLEINMEHVAMNLIFGKPIKKLMSSQVIHAELLDTINVQELNVALEINDITEYVTKMAVA